MHLKYKKKNYLIIGDFALISQIATPAFDADATVLGVRAFHDRSEIRTLSPPIH